MVIGWKNKQEEILLLWESVENDEVIEDIINKFLYNKEIEIVCFNTGESKWQK